MTTNTEKRRAGFEAWFARPEQEELRKSCAKGWAEHIWNAALDSVCVELPEPFSLGDGFGVGLCPVEVEEALNDAGIAYK